MTKPRQSTDPLVILRAQSFVHYIRARVAYENGTWQTGLLAEIDCFDFEVWVDGSCRPLRLATLWPDRLAWMATRSQLARSRGGRPIVRWNAAYRILLLCPISGDEHPTFDCIDLEDESGAAEYRKWEEAFLDPNAKIGEVLSSIAWSSGGSGQPWEDMLQNGQSSCSCGRGWFGLKAPDGVMVSLDGTVLQGPFSPFR